MIKKINNDLKKLNKDLINYTNRSFQSVMKNNFFKEENTKYTFSNNLIINNYIFNEDDLYVLNLLNLNDKKDLFLSTLSEYEDLFINENQYKFIFFNKITSDIEYINFDDFLNRIQQLLENEDITEAIYYTFGVDFSKKYFYLLFDVDILNVENENYIKSFLSYNNSDELKSMKRDSVNFLQLFKNNDFTNNVINLYSEKTIINNLENNKKNIITLLCDKNITSNIEKGLFKDRSSREQLRNEYGGALFGSFGLFRDSGAYIEDSKVNLFYFFKKIKPFNINLNENIEDYFFLLSYFYIKDMLNSEMKKKYENTFFVSKKFNNKIDKKAIVYFFKFLNKKDVIYSYNFLNLFKEYFQFLLEYNSYFNTKILSTPKLTVGFKHPPLDISKSPVGFENEILDIFFSQSLDFLNNEIKNNNNQNEKQKYSIDVYDENNINNFQHSTLLMLTLQYFIFHNIHFKQKIFINLIEKIKKQEFFYCSKIFIIFNIFKNNKNKYLKTLFLRLFKFQNAKDNVLFGDFESIYNMLNFIGQGDNLLILKDIYTVEEQYLFFRDAKHIIGKKYNLFLENISEENKNYIVHFLGVKPNNSTIRSHKHFNF